MDERRRRARRARRRAVVLRHWAINGLPAIREMRQQSARYAAEWAADNELVAGHDGPVWVVLGDSTGQAVGAETRLGGYVGQVLDVLRADGTDWRALNLSVSGAITAEVIEAQLPLLADLPFEPALVSCAAGANDLRRKRSDLDANLQFIAESLPQQSLLANMPQGLREDESRALNEQIHGLVETQGLRLVDLWSVTGKPWRGRFARDWFHPNELGYQAWTGAILAALGIDQAPPAGDDLEHLRGAS